MRKTFPWRHQEALQKLTGQYAVLYNRRKLVINVFNSFCLVLIKPLPGVLGLGHIGSGNGFLPDRTKAARQLNALTRISRYLNISSRSLLYNSFVRSNFNYCAMVWHFCGKINNNKIEKIQERALRIFYRDYESFYEDLSQQLKSQPCWQDVAVLFY